MCFVLFVSSKVHNLSTSWWCRTIQPVEIYICIFIYALYLILVSQRLALVSVLQCLSVLVEHYSCASFISFISILLLLVLSLSCYYSVAGFSDKHPFGSGQSGFATNFGHSISGEGHLGVEGIIVAQTLKIIVSRLSTILIDPSKSDNVVRNI